MDWIKAKDRLPSKYGYYLVCALPANWREIDEADALDYLKSNHGRRLAWYHNGVFWEISQPRRGNIDSNHVVVYWAELPPAPENPELAPLSEDDRIWTDAMRTDHEKVMWLTELARRYIDPGTLSGDLYKMSVYNLARELLSALGAYE
jgi:hypothetical protein